MALKLPAQFGKYVLLGMVARGGMAEVYRAKSRAEIGGFERVYAIKRILPELNENREFINSLINEAKITVTLSHSNIAQVYDLGKVDETYYVAMEYVHGVDLHTAISKVELNLGRFPSEHAIHIAMCMLAGLDVAHRKRDSMGNPLAIVHRDISPHNVLLSYSGEVKIIDFGIALAANKLGTTRRGVIKGKLLYMAPEQARADEIDHRVDLFAVAMTLYRMLTGVLPFDAQNQYDIYRNVVDCRVPNPKHYNPNIPDSLAEVLRIAMQKDPERRYQDAYEFRSQLERVILEILPGYGQDSFRAFIEEYFGNPPMPADPPTDMPTADLPVARQMELLAQKSLMPNTGKRSKPGEQTAAARPSAQLQAARRVVQPPVAVDPFEEKATMLQLDAPNHSDIEAARQQQANAHRVQKRGLHRPTEARAGAAQRRPNPQEPSRLLIDWLIPLVFGLAAAALMALITYLVVIV
ncbi:MAG: hypothetical protein CO108_25470 [Deltaproteobacteria bacterium CG_4_9_14_3_um_filter_63_12]|nr:MAG: hypothetical protein CO108_25470 [Deltaproteobacteria bacterium CG_4_9_14_3_um_filter_63_12]